MAHIRKFILATSLVLVSTLEVMSADFGVRPVEGAPAPFDERLARLVADAMNRIDLSATTDVEEEVTFLLKGVAEAVSAAQGTVTTVTWTIADGAGTPLSTVEISDVAPFMATGDPWDALDLESLRRLATKTADIVESSRDTLEVAALSAPTNKETPRKSLGSISIGPIIGAPGDGNDVLSQALAQVMQQYNVAVEPNPGPGIYYTEASVKVSRKNADAQTVRIAWKLNGPKGQNYGLVEQENDVPFGSLDIQWGDAAVYAAVAAGDGLVALMQQLGTVPPNVDE